MSALAKGSKQSGLTVLARASGFTADLIDLEIAETLRVLPGRREVYSAQLEPGALHVVVKRFLVEPKQVRNWRAEWHGLLALQEHKLPAAEPLCVAESMSDGAVWVVMRKIVDAQALGNYFLTASKSESESVVEQLCSLVNAVHAKGIRQSDQHIDNWAIADGQLYLLDAATIRFSNGPLDLNARLLDIASICVTLPPLVESAFRRSLATTYLLSNSEQRESMLGKIDDSIAEIQGTRARRYYKKTLRPCTEFQKVKNEAFGGMHLRTAPRDLVNTFFSNPETLMGEGVCLKDGNTCTVQGFERAGVSYVLKRYNLKPFLDRLRRVFSPSRARISWSSGWLLNLAFVPTAKAVAYYEEQSGLMRGRCYLLMERLDGQLLPDYVHAHRDSPQKLAEVAASFAMVWKALGRLRAGHGDLKATNLIVDAEGKVYLFDLDAFRFGLSSKVFQIKRRKDYKRFMKNWQNQPEVQEHFQQALEEEATSD